MHAKELAELYEYTNFVINANTDGIGNEESLAQPHTGGNCMNWVLGHLVCHRNKILGHAGGQPVMDGDPMTRYDRGSDPIVDDTDAVAFERLRTEYLESHERLKARFEVMSPDWLAKDAHGGKTVGQMLAGLMFHEAYHAGQLGVLRRLLGKDGALK